MLAYASRTGTRRNLDALRRAGWRLLVSATGVHRTEGFPYALDNGAWTAHQRGEPWREDLFVELVEKLGHGSDWIVAPDIVGGGLESLALSREWIPRLTGRSRVLLAVQDGMRPWDVASMLGPDTGIFVGGSTEWKLDTLPQWGALAAERGCWLHVGRVNSARRIRLCLDAGATSFDGTSASRFAVTIPRLDNVRRQMHLFDAVVAHQGLGVEGGEGGSDGET